MLELFSLQKIAEAVVFSSVGTTRGLGIVTVVAVVLVMLFFFYLPKTVVFIVFSQRSAKKIF